MTLGRRFLPFPLPLSVGTDVCQVSRIYRILAAGDPAQRRGARFAERVLTSRERELAKSREPVAWLLSPARGRGQPPAVTTGTTEKEAAAGARDERLWKAAEFLAGRFAAKEAAIKAHPHRTLTFHDIEIERRRREPGGIEPSAGGTPPVAIIRGEGGSDQEALVSISHDGDYATAVCIGFDAGSWSSNAAAAAAGKGAVDRVE